MTKSRGDNFSPRMPCQWHVRGGGEGKRRILIGQSVPHTPFGMAFGSLKLSPQFSMTRVHREQLTSSNQQIIRKLTACSLVVSVMAVSSISMTRVHSEQLTSFLSPSPAETELFLKGHRHEKSVSNKCLGKMP
jgi:hypothetical protein